MVNPEKNAVEILRASETYQDTKNMSTQQMLNQAVEMRNTEKTVAHVPITAANK